MLNRAAVAIDDALEAWLGGHAGERQVAFAIARPDAHGHRPLRFDRDDAWEPGERVAGGIRARGSTNPTVTSCRSATQNWVSISRSMASANTNPTMRIATAKPMPKIDAAARSGWRVTLRSTMRPGGAEAARGPRRLEAPTAR